MRKLRENDAPGVRKLASRILLLTLTFMIGGLPSVAVQGFAWCSMIAKAPGKSVLEAAFSSPPCEYCELARAIQPDQENKSSPSGSEKGTILLGLTSEVAKPWKPLSLPVANHFGLRREHSLHDLLEDAPLSPPPEKALQTA
jgi:hypothetical protein